MGRKMNTFKVANSFPFLLKSVTCSLRELLCCIKTQSTILSFCVSLITEDFLHTLAPFPCTLDTFESDNYVPILSDIPGPVLTNYCTDILYCVQRTSPVSLMVEKCATLLRNPR